MKRIFSMTLEEWNTVLQFASAALLGLTFAVGAGAIWTGYVLGKRQEGRIAATEHGTAEANRKAAEASERAGKLEKEAAILTEQNLKLEAAIAPRRLSERQGKALASMNAFAGHTVAIKSYSSDSEGLILATQIVDALTRSGIHLQDNRLTMQPAGSVSFGVSVDGTDKILVEELKKILAMDGDLTKGSLVLAINRGGVSFNVGFGVVTGGQPPAATIIVGAKPIK
jgi:hypothetical protein